MSFHNRSVQAHQFAMVPRADIPRAAFNIEFSHKSTFDSGHLIPVLCEEVLPGDSFSVKMTGFARLATPLFPLMDNMHLDTFFFFVPNRLVWDNWAKFMGEQKNPGDSTSFTVPQMGLPDVGYPVNSIFDYFGLPTVGQGTPGSAGGQVSALPLRAYNLIWNEWFRDQNLQDSVPVLTGDADDDWTQYGLLKRGKRPDYFTSALPWPQKGESVPISIGNSAPVISNGMNPLVNVVGGVQNARWIQQEFSGAGIFGMQAEAGSAAGGIQFGTETGLIADLSQSVSSTINALRQSFQIQKLLERDARGGTRYTEIVRAHFGVLSPDARLQRPEYLGGSSAPLTLTPIPQTSGTGTGADTPQGNLAAIGTVVARGGFSQAFTEHGYVIGLVSARADLTYQQGIRRHWTRQTRFDYYFPAFAMLGEQTILNREIYYSGNPAVDNAVFGYQERWSEYRYSPSMITGLFRSTAAGTLDAWHLSQRFMATPVLGATFIEESPPLDRVLAVGSAAGGAEFIFDSVFRIRAVRPMPVYSVPGLIDHF